MMPMEYPLFAVFSALIFGNNIILKSDEDGKNYKEILIDNVLLDLNYYFFDKDVDIINNYRRIA